MATAANLRMALSNGWTLSFGSDTPPAFCSVAAWPTENDDAPEAEQRWFHFADGQQDKRCHSLQDICEAAAEVCGAPPPGKING